MHRRRDRDPLLEVDGLQKHFPITAGLLQRQVGAVHAVDGIDFEVRAGETLGARRRVRLRQVDHGPADHPAAGADRPARSSSTARTSRTSARRAAPAAPRHPDDLPGPVLLAEPPAHGRHDHRRAVQAPGHRARGRHQEGGPGAAGARGPQPRALQPLPARVLRRPAPAHRHRPRARPAAQADRRRRAGLRAGRLHPGAGREPAGGPAGRARPHLRVHRARPVGGPPLLATASR